MTITKKPEEPIRFTQEIFSTISPLVVNNDVVDEEGNKDINIRLSDGNIYQLKIAFRERGRDNHLVLGLFQNNKFIRTVSENPKIDIEFREFIITERYPNSGLLYALRHHPLFRFVCYVTNGHQILSTCKFKYIGGI